jgi:hypothetical protein
MSKSRIREWEQQPEEPNGMFEDFLAYLALPRGDRTIAGAFQIRTGGEVGAKPPGSFYDMAEKYQWKDRARAYDREADRKIYAKIESQRATSLLGIFEAGRVLRERAAAAAKMISPVTQTIGERDGREVILVETKLTASEIARLHQVGLEMEQLAAGNPTERIQLQGDAENPLMVTVDNAKGELLKKIKDIRKRREMAEQAAEEGDES